MGKLKTAIAVMAVIFACAQGAHARALDSALRNEDVLERLSRNMFDNGCSVIGFRLDVIEGGKNSSGLEGTAYVYGESYRIESEGNIMISSDGEKWIYDASADEAVVMENNASSADIVENPFVLFDSSSGKYDCDAESVAVVRNGCYILEFEPVVKSLYSGIKVLVSEDFLPVEISFVSNQGIGYVVEILSFGKKDVDGIPAGLFVFEPGPETYITDLR